MPTGCRPVEIVPCEKPMHIHLRNLSDLELCPGNGASRYVGFRNVDNRWRTFSLKPAR